MTNNSSNVVSPVARKAMVREYGETITANLIAMGRTCVADVTQEDVRTAREMRPLPLPDETDEGEQIWRAEFAREGMVFTIGSCSGCKARFLYKDIAFIFAKNPDLTEADFCVRLLDPDSALPCERLSFADWRARMIEAGFLDESCVLAREFAPISEVVDAVEVMHSPDTGLELTLDDGLVTANNLSRRIEKNVEMVQKVYRQTLSAAVCLGFVLIDVKQNNKGRFSKLFSENIRKSTLGNTSQSVSQSRGAENGFGATSQHGSKDGEMRHTLQSVSQGGTGFTFTRRTAGNYIKLANYVAEQAAKQGRSLDLLQQVRAYIHTGVSAELDCLPDLLDAESLRQALMECGAIPRPAPKSLPQPGEPEEPQGSTVLTPEEEDETAWSHAASLLGGFQTFLREDLTKMHPDRRRFLRDSLARLLKELDSLGV